MTPQERQVLADLFERIRSAAANPRDAEAEAYIAEAVRTQPYAPYLLAQTVIVQDQALRAASERLQQLEAQVQDYQRQGAPQQQPGSAVDGLREINAGAAELKLAAGASGVQGRAAEKHDQDAGE